VPGEQRLAFVLPYQGRTLIGTTEVRQTLAEPIACSADDRDYLLAFHNRFLANPAAPPMWSAPSLAASAAAPPRQPHRRQP